ncbi:MAG: LysM peptidoglycan-binding domain-containing protein [Candidatus Sericytochromatia bacterium]|nr:LysM peptidoglycan-binding domain-containing protein [Candidatus Tanganyikabacteria bacterium]
MGSILGSAGITTTYTVKSGDSLWTIAARTMGRGDRWRELYDLNRGLIGADPGKLRVGMALRLPPGGSTPVTSPPATSGSTAVPAVPPTGPATPTRPPVSPAPPRPPRLPGDSLSLSDAARTPRPPQPKPADPPKTAAPPAAPPAAPGADSDRDGVPDEYDRAPQDAADKRWNMKAAREYGQFAKDRVAQLVAQKAEVDCADLTVKLLEDFARAKGLPNPFAGIGKWSVYTPERPGGLPNVKGPNYFRSGMHADNLAKEFTRRINDRNADGTAGFTDELGTVDSKDLRPGDILFYDWDGDGVVNHTVNVIDVADDGSVTIAFGTYDNTAGENATLTWDRLDLAPVEIKVLTPGSEDSLKYLGPLNRLWGARRFSWLPDEAPTT